MKNMISFLASENPNRMKNTERMWLSQLPTLGENSFVFHSFIYSCLGHEDDFTWNINTKREDALNKGGWDKYTIVKEAKDAGHTCKILVPLSRSIFMWNARITLGRVGGWRCTVN
jgi:hypothetical protein